MIAPTFIDVITPKTRSEFSSSSVVPGCPAFHCHNT